MVQSERQHLPHACDTDRRDSFSASVDSSRGACDIFGSSIHRTLDLGGPRTNTTDLHFQEHFSVEKQFQEEREIREY